MTKHFDFANGNIFGTKSVYGKIFEGVYFDQRLEIMANDFVFQWIKVISQFSMWLDILTKYFKNDIRHNHNIICNICNLNGDKNFNAKVLEMQLMKP